MTDVEGLHVVHVFKDYLPPVHAGITRYLADLARATAARGAIVEVHVAGERRGRRDVIDGVVVHRHRELGRVLSMPIAPGLLRETAASRADVVHVHMPNPVTELGAVLNRRATTLVCTYHAQLGKQAILEPVYGPLRNRLLARADAVVVASDALAGVEELRRAAGRLHVLPFGVSPTFSAPPSDRAERRGTLRALFVGRLVYYKGLEVLLEAIEQVPDVELTIVGDGPLLSTLTQQQVQLGLGARVRFDTTADDARLAEHHRTHDVLVLPSTSRAEAFGLSMLEGMAAGLPAISTAIGTATDWVNIDGETGIVVPPSDATGLAAAIRAMQDPDRRRTLGAAAAARARRLFSFDAHVDAILALYVGSER